MFMRLGFSLAIHSDPDVLLIDEVLAVGDASFVGRCKEKISELKEQGKTLMLVSHDLDAVERWCDEAIWIVEGRVRERGEPRRVIDAYRRYIEKGDEEELAREQEEREEILVQEGTSHAEKFMQPERWGSREIEIVEIKLLDKNAKEHLLFHPDDMLTIEMHYVVREAQDDVVFGIGLHRNDGLLVHGSNTQLEQVRIPKLEGKGVLRYRISRIGLLTGNYRLDVAVHRDDGYAFDYHKAVLQFAVRSNFAQVGVLVPPHEWELEVDGEKEQLSATSGFGRSARV
jgi:ABC-2 type transport system ATP-binding protein/lipopolysaccharide transport system ATP-binding protein